MCPYKFETGIRRQRGFSIIGVREVCLWEETTRCPHDTIKGPVAPESWIYSLEPQ
ncbi:unnamed protein product [Tuber aestivum]|uniref:Uncharacterized protein n=1 Tax=Tuber aestivum TaxID=59557 RepID=A0A292Q180_9PEZI|nr:unnamed protein product [Tuber aestivum]